MTDEEKEAYIETVKNRIFFYIEANFWSKPKMDQLRSWLANFKSLDESYCAYKLLDNFVFYSEEDIITLLRFGLEEKVIKRHILAAESNAGFSISIAEIENIKNKFISETAIIPLSSDNPSSSGFLICRYLTNEIGFPEEQVLDTQKLTSKILSKYKNVLIVDDFIGTGEQLIDFWNYDKFPFEGKQLSMCEIKDTANSGTRSLNFEYLCVAATSTGLERFTSSDSGFRNDLHITFCELLTDKFIVFGSNSIYFNHSEIDEAKRVLQTVCINAGVNFLGFSGLNYAVAFHHSIPDASLPLFFTKNHNWDYLFRNKLTDDVLY